MGKWTRGLVTMVLVAAALVRPAAAGSDELSFRILGWYQGAGDISTDQIKCEIPTVEDAIPDSNFTLGLWNTYGTQTLIFPDRNQPFANPCGGWLQFANFLAFEGLTVERVVFKLSIPGARQWRTVVPTNKAFPTACRSLRRFVQYVGNRMDPSQSTGGHSNSGEPNVVFVKMTPILRTDIIHCLRSQYAGLSTDIFTNLPVVVFATAFGVTDSGTRYRSNTINYTVNLRHTCGNGRVDDGEQCDPVFAPLCSLGVCGSDGTCSADNDRACATDADCVAVCIAQGQPMECVCN